MSAAVRVLAVDDSAVARRLVQDALGTEPDMAVDTVSSGAMALQRIRNAPPDVVTLDVEMPQLDGTATLRAIRAEFPQLPVVMVSSLTSRGATATIECLLAGANDCVEKPVATSRDEAMLRMRSELVPRIRALAGRRERDLSRPARPPRIVPPRDVLGPGTAQSMRQPALIAIGSSTGGPAALATIFAQLPRQFPVPIVITQHMPPMFTEMLAQRLSAISQIVVREGAEGAVLRPGEGWIAPGGHHMVVQRRGAELVLSLNQAPLVNSCRPAVDVMFESVARSGVSALAVILTGMGRDGSDGGRAIRRAGGRVLAQDMETSVVWGMPGAAWEDGVAERLVPLAEIAPELLRAVAPSPAITRMGALV